MSPRTLSLLTLAAVIALPAAASAAPKQSSTTTAGAACTAAAGNVHGTGLPGDQLINFMVTDGSGTNGWVLGYSSDGIWDVSVPATTGTTTYQFVSRTSGKNGSQYSVFASCSA